MQVTNSNINFRSVSYFCPAEKVMETMNNRMPKELLGKYMKEFESSPVRVTFGLADDFGDRLDATVSYKDPLNSDNALFQYIEEKRRFNLLDLAPKKFFKKVLKVVDSCEVKFDLGKNVK